MNEFSCKIALIIFLLITLIYLCWFQKDYFVLSEIDDREYAVVEKYDDPDEAANKLAQINQFNIDFMRYLREKFIWNGEGTYSQQVKVARLLQRYNPEAIIENDPRTTINTSYTQNKGELLAYCLREKRSGDHDLHDLETLKFVNLHELSHIITIPYNHPPVFWSNFKFLLQEAEKAGLYKPINYYYNPVEYCGLPIKSNPYYDATI